LNDEKAELTIEEKEFYKILATELIGTSISRIEDNSSKLLSAITIIATLYAGLVGFWVTTQIELTAVGSFTLAIPEILLIASVTFIFQAVVPIKLKKISILSPDQTYETYSEIVKYKTSRMKRSFVALILALTSILVIMLSLALFGSFFIKT